MKKWTIALLFALTACLSTNGLFAQTVDEAARREAFVKGFDQLLKNSEEGITKPAVQETLTKDGSGGFSKFAIASVAVPTTPSTNSQCNLGIKVWFQLENGIVFNPAKRKMGVKERFYVYIQPAVPVYVALFQNYPESRPESKQVYPDNRYPDSFKVVPAGQATRLPVLFEMDDDTRDEIMAMVVVRADAPQIQTTLSTQAATSVTTTGGVTTVTAQATASTAGTMKGINDTISDKDNAQAKFAICGPSQTVSPTPMPNTSTPTDTAFYMFGAGFVGQWQLTLKK